MGKKQKKGNAGCIIAVILAIFVSGLLAAGAVGAYLYSDIKGSTVEGKPITLIVDKGTTPAKISRMLKDEGLIKVPQLFRYYIGKKGADKELQYGTFDLVVGMSYDEIIEVLKTLNKDRDAFRVTFPEGITLLSYAKIMEAAGACTEEEFIETANTGDFSHYKFFSQIKESDVRFMKVEGYLFPETYEFFKGDTVYNMVDKIFGEFEKNFTDEMYARLDELGFTLDEFITLASMVQEEAGPAQHQADVAAVLYNRLKPDSPIKSLECNVSSYVQRDDDNNYIFNTIAQHYGGWDNIPKEIIAVYDTYSCIGLPAGPISNPGHDAIQNTLFPTENSPYYFFVTDLAGTYYFGKTANEHFRNCELAYAVNAKLG